MSSKIETLWIPEKPSVAKELAAALTKVRNAKITNSSTAVSDGYYMLSSGDAVCSVFGHMLQMLPPSRYLTKEQNADLMSVLPLIPDPFKFEPSYERNRDGTTQMKNGKPVVSRRFELLQKLCKQAKTIVNACDIDREGQLIFDELIAHFGRNPHEKQVHRASIVSMTPEALQQSARDLDPNGDKKWAQRGQAAATRQKMDWLLGMNASMAYQVVTNIRSMSVGRVQTPVLAMVVRRDIEIETFRPQTYFVPVIVLADGTKIRWEKRHESEGQPGFDANGRIIDQAVAQSIVDQIKAGLQGSVTVATQDEKKESPPLPFSMGSLQSEAAKQHGLTVAEVTKAAQHLYERHKAITYVGTDCRYMPEAMHDQAPKILGALATQFNSQVAGADPQIKSKAFNDKKIDEHFAIVPTGTLPNLGPAERAEKCVFETIVKRYLAQFYPDYRAKTASLIVMFGKDEFRANASKDIDLGWKTIDGTTSKGGKGENDEDAKPDKKASLDALAKYKEGQSVRASGADLDKGETSPPPRYTEDSLIRDMENAWKFTKNPEERAMLKQTEGIGTARTREPTLANLLKRQLLISKKVGKKHELISSTVGRDMIGRLPVWLTDVATTAKWETLLSAIEKGDTQADDVLNSQIAYVKQIVERARSQVKKK